MDIENQLQELYKSLDSTEDFIERMDILGEIDDIKIKLGEMLPPKPATSEIFECVGCGS